MESDCAHVGTGKQQTSTVSHRSFRFKSAVESLENLIRYPGGFLYEDEDAIDMDMDTVSPFLPLLRMSL